MQSEGNSGYSASPYSGLTNSPFPQPRRKTTGVQENFGYSDYGYSEPGAENGGIGAKAGQGPLNPYGAARRTPAYTPSVPQSNVPDYRNFTPNGPSPPLTDFYFTP